MNTITNTRTALITVTSGLAVAALASCGPAGESADASHDNAATTPTVFTPPEARDTYEVRGEITQLPAPGVPPQDLKIHHEYIPDFKGDDGEVFINNSGLPGMNVMVMPFPNLDPAVSLDGYEVGDKVAFTMLLHFDETGHSTHWIGSLEKLDADTELDLADKNPPAEETAEEPTEEPAGDSEESED